MECRRRGYQLLRHGIVRREYLEESTRERFALLGRAFRSAVEIRRYTDQLEFPRASRKMNQPAPTHLVGTEVGRDHLGDLSRV